jgi:battenin
VISTWSSGTGGAGIAGALSYAVLTGLGLSSKNTLLVMIVVPVLEGAAFWGLLRSPKHPVSVTEEKPTVSSDAEQIISEEEKPILTMTDKILYIPHLFRYMVPLALVYFFEYFINQGLFELIYFPDIWLDKGSQYVWYQVDYQIGVFISRSSVNIVQIDAIWVMAVLQGLNVVFFTFEAIYSFTPNIWIIFVLIFFEGLLGGGAYVNTFYRMAKEIKDQARQQFAISIVVWSDAVGIALAGVAALPSHNAICTLPPRNRIKVA